MKFITKKIIYWLCFITGTGLLYIGINFFVNPIQAALNYGIKTSVSSDFSFQYIKGIRDFAFGLILIFLLLRKQFGILGWILILSSIIPIADFIIVISQPNYSPSHLIAHSIATVIGLGCGIYYAKNFKL